MNGWITTTNRRAEEKARNGGQGESPRSRVVTLSQRERDRRIEKTPIDEVEKVGKRKEMK